jgi:carboxylesterase
MKRILLLLSFFTLLISCKKEGKMPPIKNTVDLDGISINDSSLVYPNHFLLSASNPSPSNADKNKPVVIAVHGFSASTFEWIEFRDFARIHNSFQTSVVLLGGHGRDYEDFRNAKWENWQQPIIDEYNKLRQLGYTNISLIGSSTGCPLIFEAIYSGKLTTDVLKHVFFIDPIVVPSNKLLSLVNVVGPVLSYSATEMAQGENGYWYKYRPYQALKELNELTQLVRKKLEKGITFPADVMLKVFKTEKDDAADPISAVLLQKGIKLSNGNNIGLQMIPSNLHVFTRLKGRSVVTSTDIQNQLATFNEIKNSL